MNFSSAPHEYVWGTFTFPDASDCYSAHLYSAATHIQTLFIQTFLMGKYEPQISNTQTHHEIFICDK